MHSDSLVSAQSTRADDAKSGEFYLGYAPPMPPRLARFVTRLVVSAGAGVVVVAAALATGHVPLEGGTFEFGRSRLVSGTIVERPYPVLVTDASTASGNVSSMLLVAPGKHGAADLARGLDGARVTLEGTRIEREGMRMLEVTPGSIVQVGEGRAMGGWDAIPGREVTLRGEIVDTKCYLGVMVPGAGRTHKECASLCVRGGLPPALAVRDRSGRSALLILEGHDGASVSSAAAAIVGEPVEVTGLTGQRGEWLTLRSDPATWRRLPLARVR